MRETYVFIGISFISLPVNSIRIFNAYGPRVKTTGVYGAVFGVFFKQKLENKAFTIVGNGNQKRDFVYVTDVVDAFFRASQIKNSGEIFNLGTGKPNSINYLVKILGGRKKYTYLRGQENQISLVQILKRLKKYLKWQPKVKFEDGVKVMVSQI